MQKIILGTRGSKLALTQTGWLKNQIKEHYPEINIEIKKIVTSGDKIKDKSLINEGGKGLFIKEIEKALLIEEVDIAVHSLKDIPGKLDSRFELACFPERQNPLDVLIAQKNYSLTNLPENVTLGTGSLRRQNQLKDYRSDFNFVNLRGNIDTRIKKMVNKKLDGIILAAAGLHRLYNKEVITQYISEDICIPAAGQGTLGIEILRKRNQLKKFLTPIDNLKARLQSKAEREFLKVIGGDCTLPLGVYVDIEKKEVNANIQIKAFLSDIEGKKVIRENLSNEIDLKQGQEVLEGKMEKMGENLAGRILSSGGSKLLP